MAGVLTQSMAHLANFFDSGRFCDFKLQAFGREFDLHRVIITASPYFESMFSSQCLEATSGSANCSFDDALIDITAFETCLRFLYGGDVPLLYTRKRARALLRASVMHARTHAPLRTHARLRCFSLHKPLWGARLFLYGLVCDAGMCAGQKATRSLRSARWHARACS